MAISDGEDILASDFISASAGAGDSGKVPKLDASGKLDKTFPRAFGCKVHSTSGQSFSAGTTIAFGAEELDSDGMHSNSVNPSRITFKTAGLWLVGACVAGSSSTSTLGITIQLNGSSDVARGGGGYASSGGASVSTVRSFSVNDYIEVIAYANGTNVTSSDQGTNFWAMLLQAA